MRYLVPTALLLLSLAVFASAQKSPEQRFQERERIKDVESSAQVALQEKSFEVALQHAERGLSLIDPSEQLHGVFVPSLYYLKAEALLGLDRQDEALASFRMGVGWRKVQLDGQETAHYDIVANGDRLLRYAEILAEAGRLEDAVAVYYAAMRIPSSFGWTFSERRLPYRVVFHDSPGGTAVPLTAENVINASRLALMNAGRYPRWDQDYSLNESLANVLDQWKQGDRDFEGDYEVPESLFPELPYMHFRVATHLERPSHYGFSMALALVQHEEDRQAIRDAMEYFEFIITQKDPQVPFRREVSEWRRWTALVRSTIPILEEHRQLLEDDPEWVNRLAGRVEAPN